MNDYTTTTIHQFHDNCCTSNEAINYVGLYPRNKYTWNWISSLSVISSTTGLSSRISSTRLPAAKVFWSVLPSAARATTGPKELISASVAIRQPSKPTRDADKNSIARSNTRITVLVTAVLLCMEQCKERKG